MALILLTDDDGYQSPGLVALYEAMTNLGDVAVFAPDHNWSAAGHTKTMHKPLRAWDGKLPNGAKATITTGAPSDCVAMALLGLLPERPDMVVSGINLGANLGSDLTYSGTVAGAMEAVIGGVTAFSISIETTDPEADLSLAAMVAARLGGLILRMGMPPNTFLNVNVPNLPRREVRGIQVTRLGRRIYRDVLVRRIDPKGKPYYWIGGDVPTGIPEDGTDIGALANGYISVTPIRMDMTDYRFMESLRDWPLSEVLEP